MLSVTERMLVGTHTGFLQQITGKWARQKPDRTFVTPSEGEVLGGVGMKSAATYLGHRQGVVSQWVALRPIFEVFEMDQVYRGVRSG